jgi:phospholipid/cholesterol/gamma-HCH transport system substrate-binding protein
MQTIRLSFNVLFFLVLGCLSLTYLFVTLGELNIRGAWEYTVYADFSSASGLDPGSAVEIAGVRVGRVTGIELNGARSRVAISLNKDVRLQEDVIASIQTKGLLGERYILLSPGGSEDYIKPEGKIRETEAPIDIPGLMAAYIASRNKSAPDKKPTETP